MSLDNYNRTSVQKGKRMKKVISILISLVLIITLFVPVSAVAGEKEETKVSRNGCSHPSYRSTYVYSYECTDTTYHEVYVTERRWCVTCNELLEVIPNVNFYMTKHTGTPVYEKSVHLGDPSAHYHLFAWTCTICYGRAEERISSKCKASNCNSFYSFGKPELLLQ